MLRRAEQFHDDLDPATAYPFAYLAFRLTGFRRDHGDDSLLIGQALRPDLRLLIDQLSHGLDLPASDGDALTAPQLAARLNVSTKTLSRWRKAGLRWRWITVSPPAPPSSSTLSPPSHNPTAKSPPVARKVIAFTANAVEHFRQLHPERIDKAATFTQLTPAQRARLLQRARRLAAATDATFNQVAAHLSRRSGRALETIRLILEKHDRDHPGDQLFADRTGPLTPRQKRLISRAYRMGIHVGKLAERFRRSRATIYRVILDRRAARRTVCGWNTSTTRSLLIPTPRRCTCGRICRRIGRRRGRRDRRCRWRVCPRNFGRSMCSRWCRPTRSGRCFCGTTF